MSNDEMRLGVERMEGEDERPSLSPPIPYIDRRSTIPEDPP
jgi:hypothetical protein